MKIKSFLNVAMVVISSIGLVAMPQTANAAACSGAVDFTATGDGSIGDPYEISTAENLIWLSQNQTGLLDKNFIQTANLDLGQCDFAPIGNPTTPFSGTYDGNAKVISGLNVVGVDDLGTGLFGKLTGTVQRLGIHSGSISGSRDNVGLIAGVNAGNISQVYATGAVSGDTNVGGIVGDMVSGSITDSWADVDVTATNFAGGFIGSRTSGTIVRNFSMGQLSSLGAYVGGFLGSQSIMMAAVDENYYNSTTSAKSASAMGVGLTDAEFKVKANYEGWDFGTPIWKIDGNANSGYPYLAWQPIIPNIASTAGTDFWFTFDLNSSVNTVGWKYIYVSSPVDTTATLTLPNASVISIPVIAGVTSTVDVESQASVLENAADEGTANNGLHLTAPVPVSVYTVHTKSATSDGSSVLPTSSLGYEYLAVAPFEALSYSHLGNLALQRISILAAEPGTTTVTITPKVNLKGNRTAGTPYTVTLTQGQVYTVIGNERTTDAATTDISGTKISSNRKVSVQTSAYFDAFKLQQSDATYTVSGAADHTYEQMIPTSAWGTTYIAARGAHYQSTTKDAFIVIARDNNTQISVNGVAIATLNAGQTKAFINTSPSIGADLVSADKPISLTHITTGQTTYNPDGSGTYLNGAPSGDPAFTMQPAINQYLNSYVISAPATGFTVNMATVIALQSEKALVTHNGYAVGASRFVDIPNTSYARAWVPIAKGTSYFRAPSGFMLEVGGYNSYDSYTYSGGFGLVDPIAYPGGVPELQALQDPTKPVSVGGDSISGIPNKCGTLSVSEGGWLDGRSAITGTTYQWFRNGLPISGATGSNLSANSLTVGDLISFEIRKTNALGTTSAFSTPVRIIDNLPTGLAFSTGTLSPSFDPCVSSYTLNVIQNWLTLSAAAPSDVGLSLNGNSLLANQDSAAQSLNLGANTLTLTSTKSGVTQTYTVTVNYTSGPTAQMTAVTNLLDTSVTLNASLNANGNSFTAVSFEYATLSDFSDAIAVSPTLPSGTGALTISKAVTGLTGAQRYFARAVVTNSVGTVTSQPFEFTTKAAPAISSMTVARDSSVDTKLNVSAYVTPNAAATQLIFSYSYNSDLSNAQDVNISTTTTVNATKSGSITDLTKGALVYYQFRVVNQYGTNYGPISSFQMKAAAEFAPPSFTIGSRSATIEFPVNPHSSATDLLCIAIKDTNSVSGCTNTTSLTPSIVDGNEFKSASYIFTGLLPSTTYYVKATARNYPTGSSVVTYSDIYSFTTSAAPALTSQLEGPISVGPLETILLTFRFSEAIVGFDKTDVVISGTTAGWTTQPTYEVEPGLYLMEIRPTGVVTSPSTLTVSAATPGTSSAGAAFPAVNTLNISVVAAAPNISYSASPMSLTQFQAMSATPTNSGGAAATYQASPALPAGLTISNTGIISGTPTVSQSATNYTITATNAAGSSSTVISIAVSSSGLQSPTISYSGANFSFERGSAITPLNPALGGGAVSSITVSPALPAGLSINSSTGVISGTATVFSTAKNYIVTAANAAGSSTATLRISTFESAPDIAYGQTSYQVTQFSPMTPIIPINSGGAGYFLISSGTLPTGLSLDSATGAISGTPAGTRITNNATAVSVTIRVTNSAGTQTVVLSIQLTPALPDVSYASRTVQIQSSMSSVSPTLSTTSGGVTSYSISPALPVGMTLNTTSGAISGTPTQIPLSPNFTITATNSAGSSTAAWSLTVTNRSPVFSYAGSPYTANELQAFTSGVPVISYGAGVTFSISPALPAGLSIDTSTGLISGTPSSGTLQAATNYVVTGTNSAGTLTRTISLRITNNPVMQFAYGSNTLTFTESSAISNQIPTVTAGTPTTWSVSPALPSGLSFSTVTGAITGTPVRGARQSLTSYTISATDGTSNATYPITITIAPQPIQFIYQNASLSLTETVAMSPENPAAVSSNILPLTFSISPQLPAGLSLNPTSGEISGTPASGTEQIATTYTITGVDGALTETFVLTIEIAQAPVIVVNNPQGDSSPYQGPIIDALSKRTANPGESLAAFGKNFGTIIRLRIAGIDVEVRELTENRFAFDLPLSLTPGAYDLLVYSSYGLLTVQDAFEVGISAASTNFWTKRSSASVRFVAKGIIGVGKIQFIMNGKEIAWIRAEDETDPKLFSSSNTKYFNRNAKLSNGKNRVEIRLNGKQVWRATYSKK